MDEFISTFNTLLATLPPIPEFIKQDYFLSALPDDLSAAVQTDGDNLETIDTLQDAASRLASIYKSQTMPDTNNVVLSSPWQGKLSGNGGNYRKPLPLRPSPSHFNSQPGANR